MLVHVEHAPRIRRELDGAEAALPRRLNPHQRFVGEHIGALAQQRLGVSVIRRQRHHRTEFLDRLRLRAAEQQPAQPGTAPQPDLFGEQPFLDIHILLNVEIQKATVFVPQRFVIFLSKLVLQTHAHSPLLSGVISRGMIHGLS